MTHEGEESQSTPPYRSRVRCGIWPEPARQTRKALLKMSEIHVRVCFPSFPDNFQNEAIFDCNLLCLFPIKRDYRSINIAYVGASHFLSQSRFIFLEEHKGKKSFHVIIESVSSGYQGDFHGQVHSSLWL